MVWSHVLKRNSSNFHEKYCTRIPFVIENVSLYALLSIASQKIENLVSLARHARVKKKKYTGDSYSLSISTSIKCFLFFNGKYLEWKNVVILGLACIYKGICIWCLFGYKRRGPFHTLLFIFICKHIACNLTFCLHCFQQHPIVRE